MATDTLDEPRFREAFYGAEAENGKPAAAGPKPGEPRPPATTREQAAVLTYAGQDTATEVLERLRQAWPGGLAAAQAAGSPGVTRMVPVGQLRAVMAQPYPERVDGYRAQLRADTADLGASLGVTHGDHTVLVDGTHRAAARALEGQEEIPVRVLDLSAGPGASR